MADLDGQLSIEDRLSAILEASDSTQDDGPDEEASAAPQPEIQPAQTEAPSAEVEGANASEEAPAPAVETTAPVASEAPKTNPEAPKVASERVVPEPSATPEAAAAISQQLQNITSFVQSLQADAAGKFSDIKTEADVLQMMQQTPERYNEFVIAQTRLSRAMQAQQVAQQEASKAYMAGEQQKLIKAIPDLADPEKGDALKAKLRAYAKAQGIPDNRQARSADEVIRLHREMTLADELNAYKSKEAEQVAKLAEANKKAAKAPPVQQPGSQRDTNTNEKVTTDFARFQKSGHLNDLAQALTHIL